MSPSEAERYMRAALIEGRKAIPACLPNPPVGCVLVKGGEIVARGHTQPPSQPHAEAAALAQLSGSLDDVTVFVTLEPCSFHGRTPSCAKALIERGVKRVFVAVLDPDPRNDGRGIEMLRLAGVDVSVGLLRDETLKDLADFLVSKQAH